MANINFTNITDFKISGDDRTITKVRVSMDDGKTWGVLFSKSNQSAYYYELVQEGETVLDLAKYNSEDINFIVFVYDASTNNYIEEYNDTISTNYYDLDEVAEEYGYGYDTYVIANVTETHYVEIDGVEYELKAEVKLVYSDYTEPPQMNRCPECGELYEESLGSCPHCSDMQRCENCGYEYDINKYADCPVCNGEDI